MSISQKAQHDKIAKKIIARRAKKQNNNKPAVEDTEDVEDTEALYTIEGLKDHKKKDLMAIIDDVDGLEYGKDDKRDALVAIVLTITE